MKRIIIILLLPYLANALFSQEEIIGETTYDLQTNGSCQNRVYYYEDGFIGATWTYGMQYTVWPDRGTGYNYLNGTAWQATPTERIESLRTGWPSYAPLGENGELIVAHLSNAEMDGLLFNKRTNKGEGVWEESLFLGPVNHEDILWPRMITGGENHNHIYLISLSLPIANGGAIYNGLNGALLYSRSTDKGETWDIQNQILPGMDSSEYFGFAGDCYAFAEPKENIIAFVVGSYWTDMFLMKSTDYGQTFEKTIIWEHPYPFFDPATPSTLDTFYSVDGSLSVALDIAGKAHVVFGTVRNYYSDEWRFDRTVDGIGYWNEDRESFSSNKFALNPAGGPGSEMIPDYNLIGWSQDMNGNGQLDFDDFGIHGPFGLSSMVQIIIDEANRIFLCYTSITEGYFNNGECIRRLWFRSSYDSGNTWGQFYHYIPDNPYQGDFDFMFPSCAANSGDYIHCIYLTGFEPGLYWFGGSETPENNEVRYDRISKDEIVGIKESEQIVSELEVSQNFPNPFSESTTIMVNLQKPTDIKLEVENMLGERVYEMTVAKGYVGLNTITIQADDLTPGIYFYTVIAGESSLTKKMIVK